MKFPKVEGEYLLTYASSPKISLRTTPGTYKYFCSLHPHMTGTIVVTEGSRRGDISW